MKRQVKWMVYGIMLLLSVGCREDVDALVEGLTQAAQQLFPSLS